MCLNESNKYIHNFSSVAFFIQFLRVLRTGTFPLVISFPLTINPGVINTPLLNISSWSVIFWIFASIFNSVVMLLQSSSSSSHFRHPLPKTLISNIALNFVGYYGKKVPNIRPLIVAITTTKVINTVVFFVPITL